MPTMTTPDLTKIERPNIDIPEFDLPKIDLPSKSDVSKAVMGAATAVGLMPKRRPRWPYLLGAGIAVAAVGWAWMNVDMLRERGAQAVKTVTSRVGAMRDDTDVDEAVAFTAAETAGPDGDYPNGFGAPADMAGTNGEDVLALDEVTVRG